MRSVPSTQCGLVCSAACQLNMKKQCMHTCGNRPQAGKVQATSAAQALWPHFACPGTSAAGPPQGFCKALACPKEAEAEGVITSAEVRLAVQQTAGATEPGGLPVRQGELAQAQKASPWHRAVPSTKPPYTHCVCTCCAKAGVRLSQDEGGPMMQAPCT